MPVQHSPVEGTEAQGNIEPASSSSIMDRLNTEGASRATDLHRQRLQYTVPG